jgi:hypothetical protein
MFFLIRLLYEFRADLIAVDPNQLATAAGRWMITRGTIL